jgi:antitoxin component YwqK of YwqJK toxin-antitoxin module
MKTKILFEYYSLDKKQVYSKREFLNDVEHGLQRYFYANGTIEREMNYINGKLHGIQKFWYKNGNLEQVNIHCKGLIKGITQIFHENVTRRIIEQSKKNVDMNIFQNGIHIIFNYENKN